MKSKLLLKISCRNQTTAKRLASVLAPDNRGIPADQHFSMDVVARSVVFRIETEGLRSGLTTALSILRDVELFQEIWLISRGKGG